MSREILKDIIQDFSPERFIDFFRTKNRSFRPHNEYISEYDDDDFRDALSIGQIPFHQTEKLIAYSFRANKDLSERSGKKLQYEKGKKILKDKQADAGIFIFFDANNNFRFSLIYFVYAGTQRKGNNFKRFTYFVSPELTNKTFIHRIGDGDFSSIEAIKEAFSVEKVTKEFYSEIANWYFWALKEARFPKDAEAEPKGRNIALIRLITRIIFIWFMRQKGIIKKELFDRESLKGILKDLSDKEGTYYKAILQNLFFSTLNTPIEQRKFRREERYKGYLNKDYMNHTYFRHHSLFKDPDRMKEFFNDIPFLNGGLFECLDKRKDDESNDTNREIRIDGFSDDPKKQPYVPNILFFSEEREVDLNEDYGTKNKRYRAKGLINILTSYNFTIDENTPVDEEIALDPELLGRVFENLLASYNPETSTTARKATGSYYTPREIVDYMVRESIKEYFKVKAPDIDENSLNQLFLYDEDKNPFNDKTTEEIVNAIQNLKLIDPAVGSGAFPMGVLHTLVHILHKLDPHNEKWKEQQIKAVQHILDPQLKQETLKRIEESFTLNELDYGRKLYLIQNCIYGVDIQPIAIQIAKLRFFISLLVDERVDKTKPNYSIEPLPNLETKFVSANTLIGLPRPSQLSLQTHDVKKLEDDLKEIRNQYFIAYSAKEKEKLKKKDAELRKALATSLSIGGMGSDITEKIARWNPYDTNKSADWFDPEWMFGIESPSPLAGEGRGEGGFDVVIGNPPYITLALGRQRNVLTELQVRQYRKLYPGFVEYKGNTFSMFIGLSAKILSANGVMSFIIPNTLLLANTMKQLRLFILTQFTIQELINIHDRVFEEAEIGGNLVFRFSLTQTKEHHICAVVHLENFESIYTADRRYVEQASFKKFNDYRFSIDTSKSALMQRVATNTKTLGEIASFYNGIKTGDNKRFLSDKKSRSKDEEVLRGRDVHRYFIEYGNGFVYFDPAQLWSNANETKLRKKPKIVVRQTGDSIVAALDDCGVLTLDTTHLIFDTLIPIKAQLAILNSQLINWYYHSLVEEVGRTFAEVKIVNLKKLPISMAAFDPKNCQIFVGLVDQILAAKKKDPNADTSVLECQIDKMVYALYGLTPEEIEIVEGSQ